MTEEKVEVQSDVPISYLSNVDFDETKLSSRVDVNRELTRYVFCLGDHIEAADKIKLKNAGAWAGGIWVGHSEVEGAPTMRRTGYMIFRGAIVPLEITSIPRKADHREIDAKDENYLVGKDVPPNTRGYTVYPGVDLNYLQSDRYRPLGVVEITPLMGHDWSTGSAILMQLHFFPEWNNWAANISKPPVLLSDWRTLLNTGINKAPNEQFEIAGSEMLESIRLFEQYATSQVERNRQIILSMRNTNTGGFFVGWSEKTKLFARQLGQTLEDERNIKGESTDAIASELAEDRKLRLEELAAQREQNRLLIELISKNIGTPGGGTPVEVIEEQLEKTEEAIAKTEEEEKSEDEIMATNVSGVEEPNTVICDEPNRDGSQCRSYVAPGETTCSRHKALKAK